MLKNQIEISNYLKNILNSTLEKDKNYNEIILKKNDKIKKLKNNLIKL
jgi:hypothetical protein